MSDTKFRIKLWACKNQAHFALKQLKQSNIVFLWYMRNIYVMFFLRRDKKKGRAPVVLGRFLIHLCLVLLGKSSDRISRFSKISCKANPIPLCYRRSGTKGFRFILAGTCSPELPLLYGYFLLLCIWFRCNFVDQIIFNW